VCDVGQLGDGYIKGGMPWNGRPSSRPGTAMTIARCAKHLTVEFSGVARNFRQGCVNL